MTCATWTNKEQNWLEACKAKFIEANQRRAAAKEFFPEIVKEFWEKWPVPAVSQEEIDKAGSVGLATKTKHDKYDKVLVFDCAQKYADQTRCSMSMVGSTTTAGMLPVQEFMAS